MDVINIVIKVMETVMEAMEIVIEVVETVMEVIEVASRSVVRAIASCRTKLRGFKGGETRSQGLMQG